MALSYNLGYQESISVHPTRRQNFAGKPYSNFPNIWEWLLYTVVNVYLSVLLVIIIIMLKVSLTICLVIFILLVTFAYLRYKHREDRWLKLYNTSIWLIDLQTCISKLHSWFHLMNLRWKYWFMFLEIQTVILVLTNEFTMKSMQRDDVIIAT